MFTLPGSPFQTRRFVLGALALLLLYACSLPLSANGGNQNAADLPEALRHHLNMLKEAQAPKIIANHLVFSAAGTYRSVGIAFDHDDWSSVSRFQKNDHGIFVFWLPLPFGNAKTLHYRMVFDGLWTHDPANPAWQRDPRSGLKMSQASLPERSEKVYGIWHPGLNGQSALFYFEGQAGQRVTVSGSFNGWDPFLHELMERQPGKYELEIALPPGTYYYVFVYQGQRINDPLNKAVALDPAGRQVSILTMKRP